MRASAGGVEPRRLSPRAPPAQQPARLSEHGPDEEGNDPWPRASRRTSPLPPAYDSALVRYRLLGQVRAERAGEPLPPGTPKQQALLAALLLRGGEQVERTELVRAVWGEHAPDSAAGLLATYTARLRKALEPDRARRAAPRLLITRGTTYGLHLRRDALDLWRFEDVLSEARRERRAGRVGAARTCYERALAQWRGEQALSGVPERCAADARHRLAGLRLDARLEHAEALLDLGEHAEAAERIAPLVPGRPYDERLQALLMLALYRSGRTPEALALFRGVRRALVHDLGVEPRPGLSRLHERILHADPRWPRPGSRRGHSRPRVRHQPTACPCPLNCRATAPTSPAGRRRCGSCANCCGAPTPPPPSAPPW